MSTSSSPNSGQNPNRVAIYVALIGLIGALAAAITPYFIAQMQLNASLQATRTADARLTAIASVAATHSPAATPSPSTAKSDALRERERALSTYADIYKKTNDWCSVWRKLIQDKLVIGPCPQLTQSEPITLQLSNGNDVIQGALLKANDDITVLYPACAILRPTISETRGGVIAPWSKGNLDDETIGINVTVVNGSELSIFFRCDDVFVFQQDLNNTLGSANWSCEEGKMDVINIHAIPPNLTVDYPLVRVRTSSGEYHIGQVVPGAGKATAYLEDILPPNECP